ncbi:MAG: ATP-binding protein [Eubacterium sp.]|nr:ATP-binding protein [Eubacterium sp.]
MKITVHGTPENTKSILDLLEDHEVSLPCNCHGANACGGKQYDFPCNLIPHEDITVTIHPRESFGGLALSSDLNKNHLPDTVLIDLGTTTIAIVYYSSLHKTVFYSEVFPNPQLPFGADVISRIKYDTEAIHKHELTHIIHDTLSQHYNSFLASHKKVSIETCLIGGNTTMIHLLLGLSLEGMKAAPFTPVEVSPDKLSFHRGGTEIRILPWLSAFIGGDIVSGMLYLNFESRKDTCLLVDLGTNGELALVYDQKIYTAGTAAGPAFEGGGLSCGTPAVPGAISDISLRGILPQTQTIGNKLPTGICGSGAVSILSQLLTSRYMDHSGILTDKFPEDGLILSRTPTGKEIRFTKQDVRQMQLAVAAIGAGIDTLCHTAGISVDCIDQLYLAGGLGYHISISKAAASGMFSSVDVTHIHAVGNSCLLGLASVSQKTDNLSQRIKDICQKSQEVILADDCYFQKEFIRHMTY